MLTGHELIPDGDGTIVRQTHSDLPVADAAAEYAHGCEHYLGRLQIAAPGGGRRQGFVADWPTWTAQLR